MVEPQALRLGYNWFTGIVKLLRQQKIQAQTLPLHVNDSSDGCFSFSLCCFAGYNCVHHNYFYMLLDVFLILVIVPVAGRFYLNVPLLNNTH